jgi:hypothetical protein
VRGTSVDHGTVDPSVGAKARAMATIRRRLLQENNSGILYDC